MKQIIIVLAYDYGAYVTWCLRNGVRLRNNLAFYVHTEQQLRGIRDPLVLKLEGWYKNQDYTPYFSDMLSSRGRKAPPREITEQEALKLLTEAGFVKTAE